MREEEKEKEQEKEEGERSRTIGIHVILADLLSASIENTKLICIEIRLELEAEERLLDGRIIHRYPSQIFRL